MNVKTHVFKKELQEYVPTQLDDRLRIETIIYVELSIVDQVDGSLVRNYDYVRLPKELFFAQPDKEMTAEEMASKRILNVEASLQCPSNNWQVETEACVRCARRMSAKLEQNESRVSVYFFNESWLMQALSHFGFFIQRPNPNNTLFTFIQHRSSI